MEELPDFEDTDEEFLGLRITNLKTKNPPTVKTAAAPKAMAAMSTGDIFFAPGSRGGACEILFLHTVGAKICLVVKLFSAEFAEFHTLISFFRLL